MSKDIVRVLRIVVYEGERDWVERMLLKSGSGTVMEDGINKIYANTIGGFPEILVKDNEIRYACGDEKSPGHFDMWFGPVPTEIECKGQLGHDNTSVIIKFDGRGTDIIAYRWSLIADKWMPEKDNLITLKK